MERLKHFKKSLRVVEGNSINFVPNDIQFPGTPPIFFVSSSTIIEMLL